MRDIEISLSRKMKVFSNESDSDTDSEEDKDEAMRGLDVDDPPPSSNKGMCIHICYLCPHKQNSKIAPNIIL